MPKFYLPCSPVHAIDSLLVHGDEAWRFPSRQAALTFIMNRCREDRTKREAVVISIEGQDGQWRSFDTQLKPLPEKS